MLLAHPFKFNTHYLHNLSSNLPHISRSYTILFAVIGFYNSHLLNAASDYCYFSHYYFLPKIPVKNFAIPFLFLSQTKNRIRAKSTAPIPMLHLPILIQFSCALVNMFVVIGIFSESFTSVFITVVLWLLKY